MLEWPAGIFVYSNICKWILRRLLLIWLLSRIELTHVHLLVLLRESLESVVVLWTHHARSISHEWIRLVLHRTTKRILAHILLLLLHHHVGLELLLHVGRHHLHHLVLLSHVHLRLLLLVTHWVRDETSWSVWFSTLRLLLLLLRHLIWHIEGISARHSSKIYLLLLHGLLSVHVSRTRVKIEDIDVLSSLWTRSSNLWTWKQSIKVNSSRWLLLSWWLILSRICLWLRIKIEIECVWLLLLCSWLGLVSLKLLRLCFCFSCRFWSKGVWLRRTFVFTDCTASEGCHIFKSMIEACIKIERLLFFLFFFTTSSCSFLLRGRAFWTWSLCWWGRAFRIHRVDLFQFLLVWSVQIRFYLLISLSLSYCRFKVIVSGLFLPFKLLECTFSLRIFTFATAVSRTAWMVSTFTRRSLSIHYLQIHGLCCASLTRCRRHNLIDLLTKLMYLERVVARVLILPSKRIFTFFLLPEHLEHSAIEHDIEPIINWLNVKAFSVHVHLIDKGVWFPTQHSNIFG